MGSPWTIPATSTSRIPAATEICQVRAADSSRGSGWSERHPLGSTGTGSAYFHEIRSPESRPGRQQCLRHVATADNVKLFLRDSLAPRKGNAAYFFPNVGFCIILKTAVGTP